MPTKREMQEEIDRLRKQLKQHENLMMETAMKIEAIEAVDSQLQTKLQEAKKSLRSISN